MTDEELIARLRWKAGAYAKEAADRIEKLVATNKALVNENAEFQQTFDMQWKADMRAIKMWQEAHPGNEMVWPDGAKLTVWLMEVADKQAALLADAYGADLDWDDVLKQRADHEAVKKIEALERERDQWIEHTKNAVWADSEELKLANARAERLEAALRVARVHVANNAEGWSVSRGASRDDLTIVDAALKGEDHE